jgi:cytochrome d ubiquinol oxidase subunit II
MRRSVRNMAVPFLALSIAWFVFLLLRPGFSVDADGIVSMEDYKYFMNFMHHSLEGVQLFLGGLLLLVGLYFGVKRKSHRKGFWFTVAGTLLMVMGLFFLAGFHGTAYYPSVTSLQSSLTLQNSSADFDTLQSLSGFSLVIPVAIVGLGYVWHRVDHRKKIAVGRMLREKGRR